MRVGEYFDRYWLSTDTFISDARSLEKASIVDTLLGAVEGEILDAGCGRGIVAAFLTARGREVVGVDASPAAVSAARERGVDARVLDLSREEPPGSYSAALCLDVLQHSADPLSMLKRVARSVVGPGPIIISLPNEFHLFRRIGIVFGRFGFARFDGPHPRLFWKEEIVRLLRDAGLDIEAVVPAPLTPPRHRLAAFFGRPLARVFPSLMAIGYVVKTSRLSAGVSSGGCHEPKR